jgi:hypothetical protein
MTGGLLCIRSTSFKRDQTTKEKLPKKFLQCAKMGWSEEPPLHHSLRRKIPKEWRPSLREREPHGATGLPQLWSFRTRHQYGYVKPRAGNHVTVPESS